MLLNINNNALESAGIRLNNLNRFNQNIAQCSNSFANKWNGSHSQNFYAQCETCYNCRNTNKMDDLSAFASTQRDIE